MFQTGLIFAGIVGLWSAVAFWLSNRQGIGFRQAFLYAPLKLAFRIDDSSLRKVDHGAPVIYAISHQSRLDPALMLSLLPSDTLHILDEASSRAGWLEPWRELARTIAFKAQHVFVSRRLTRRLKSKGRLAVYFPFDAEPDVKSFRIYRAVAKIGVAADAKIVPIYIRGSSHLPGAYEPADKTPRQLLPKLRITALPAKSIDELVEEAGPVGVTTSNALFDRVAEARFRSQGRPKTIFHSVRSAALLYGPGRVAIEDVAGETLTYRALFARARALSGRLVEMGTGGDTVGLLLPNAAASVATFLALQSAGRVVALLNPAGGTELAGSAVRVAAIRTVVTSRAFVERLRLTDDVAAMEQAGARIVWLEDVESGLTIAERLLARIAWRARRLARKADDPAVILFTPGTEGIQKAVVLSHANLIANAAQIEARMVLSRGDTILSVLPPHTALGLTAGLMLPLMKGVRALAYPSPLHTRQIPQIAATRRPTILFATDALLQAYAKAAQSADFDSLRLVICGGERLRAATRTTWRERFGIDIMEGYGATEAAPVVAVNSITHGRTGTVGRLLPGMKMRFAPVDGLADGGRLQISGPNIALGHLTESSMGQMIMPEGGWYDTGDIVTIDREGYLTLVGRASRTVSIAGQTVSLTRIEQLSEAIWPEDGHAAIVIGGDAPRIVLATTRENTPDIASLRRGWKKVGADAASLPSAIISVKTLPTLSGGRIDHARLQRIAEEQLGLSSAA